MLWFFEAENSFLFDFFSRLFLHLISCKIFMCSIRKRLPSGVNLHLSHIRISYGSFCDHKFYRAGRLWKGIHLLWRWISICRTRIYIGITFLLLILWIILILIVRIPFTLIILIRAHKRMQPISIHLFLKNMAQIFILFHLLLKNLLQFNCLIPYLPNIQFILLYWLLGLFNLLFEPFHFLKILGVFTL